MLFNPFIYLKNKMGKPSFNLKIQPPISCFRHIIMRSYPNSKRDVSFNNFDIKYISYTILLWNNYLSYI